MLTTVKIINYLFSMNNCSVKASKSYENLNWPSLLVIVLQLSFRNCTTERGKFVQAALVIRGLFIFKFVYSHW
jgi:hypothetical protein